MNSAVDLERIPRFLAELGASGGVMDELLRYNESAFVFDHQTPNRFPLADEPFVAAWEGYLDEAKKSGVFAALRSKLVQFEFPIAPGISETPEYLAATRQGKRPLSAPEGGLCLVEPESLELIIHPTLAGRLPVLITRNRADFESLLRAFTLRNEPAPIPRSQGACMVAGYNNWNRIAALREAWESDGSRDAGGTWENHFAQIKSRKELYQDRFILLSDGPYSGVSALDLGLDEDAWKAASLAIRREHECAHYFTKRVLLSMRNQLLDEILADFMGITAACGRFRADWFLRFMGLENYPDYRQGGRLQNYRGTPPVSDEAFRILATLLKRAAENLERFSSFLKGADSDRAALMTISRVTLAELAFPDAPERLIGSAS